MQQKIHERVISYSILETTFSRERKGEKCGLVDIGSPFYPPQLPPSFIIFVVECEFGNGGHPHRIPLALDIQELWSIWGGRVAKGDGVHQVRARSLHPGKTQIASGG